MVLYVPTSALVGRPGSLRTVGPFFFTCFFFHLSMSSSNFSSPAPSPSSLVRLTRKDPSAELTSPADRVNLVGYSGKEISEHTMFTRLKCLLAAPSAETVASIVLEDNEASCIAEFVNLYMASARP